MYFEFHDQNYCGFLLPKFSYVGALNCKKCFELNSAVPQMVISTSSLLSFSDPNYNRIGTQPIIKLGFVWSSSGFGFDS